MGARSGSRSLRQLTLVMNNGGATPSASVVSAYTESPSIARKPMTSNTTGTGTGTIGWSAPGRAECEALLRSIDDARLYAAMATGGSGPAVVAVTSLASTVTTLQDRLALQEE